MAFKLLRLPQELQLEILCRLVADVKQSYISILLIHPKITALCNAYRNAIFVLWRSWLIHKFLSPVSFVYLAVYIHRTIKPKECLSHSVYDFDKKTLEAIRSAALDLRPIYSWFIVNKAMNARLTRFALLSEQRCTFPEFIVASISARPLPTAPDQIEFTSIVDEIQRRSELSAENEKVGSRWLRELAVVHAYRDFGGSLYILLTDELDRKLNAARKVLFKPSVMICAGWLYPSAHEDDPNWKRLHDICNEKFPAAVSLLPFLSPVYSTDLVMVIERYGFSRLWEFIKMAEHIENEVTRTVTVSKERAP